MTRKQAREKLFELIYEMNFQPELDASELLKNANDHEALNEPYITNSFAALQHTLPAVDDQIKAHIKGWNFSRISAVSLAILRLCIFEILYNDDVPDNVAMNEAIELAKRFDHHDAPAFINGVVNAVAQEKRNHDAVLPGN